MLVINSFYTVHRVIWIYCYGVICTVHGLFVINVDKENLFFQTLYLLGWLYVYSRYKFWLLPKPIQSCIGYITWPKVRLHMRSAIGMAIRYPQNNQTFRIIRAQICKGQAEHCSRPIKTFSKSQQILIKYYCFTILNQWKLL